MSRPQFQKRQHRFSCVYAVDRDDGRWDWELRKLKRRLRAAGVTQSEVTRAGVALVQSMMKYYAADGLPTVEAVVAATRLVLWPEADWSDDDCRLYFRHILPDLCDGLTDPGHSDHWRSGKNCGAEVSVKHLHFTSEAAMAKAKNAVLASTRERLAHA